MVPEIEDMPRRNLPLSITDDALITVAMALYAGDMAGADDDGRMCAEHTTPTVIVKRGCEVRGRSYSMTVTVTMTPENA